MEENEDKLQKEVVAEEKHAETDEKKQGQESEKDNETVSETDAVLEEKGTSEKKEDDAENLQEEIDESNAEDAEDKENEKRHHIPMLDYHSMSLENLVGELQRLVKNEKVQAIHKHVNNIKHEFDAKFREFIEEKKEEFVANGGNEIDFRYNSVTKRQFNEVYNDYREKRDAYYKNLEKNLKTNLEKRLAIIEELKGLVNVEEDMNTTYKNFKALQDNWRNAGPVPRNQYNDVWRTYHHHVEIFYDFLHLNRELRDLDFKHNLEEKIKLVEKAEALADEPNMGKAFRELQTLHKIWKEDIGPVAKEQREEIWERFSNATKAMHQRRQDYQKELDAQYEENLVKKRDLIASIDKIGENAAKTHSGIQKQIKEVEALREQFFKAGRVPQKENNTIWTEFKTAVRAFNRNKNAFYKELKKDQLENLEKKKKLLETAESLKDSEDFDTATPEMKRIQSEWKKIGHVPRKYSDKIWAAFKGACNHYFDRLHSQRNQSQKDEYANYEKKNACLERLKNFKLTDKKEENLAAIKGFINEWKTYGRLPYNKRHLNVKFNKIIDALLKKLGVGRHEAELLKYGNKIQQLSKADDERAISNERTFIKRKISESKNELRQLENNLQFFSNASEESPLVQDVIKKIDRHKESLGTWKGKLKKLNIMQNQLDREPDEEDTAELSSEEE